MSFKDSLDNIRTELEAITQTPYCSGTVPLDPATGMLFYTKDGKAQAINFSSATNSQLGLLSEACHKVTFDPNNTIVLDESHKSGMDPLDFACQFSPWASGIVDIVKDRLLIRKHSVDNGVQVVLSKLNVYGPGPFFKAPVDAPRSEAVVASLVVILPTEHEGGSLIIPHECQEHIIDSAEAVNSHPTPHAAFVAFYSDVEHEVAPVTSGYCVTLTYNIYVTELSSQDQARSSAIIDSQRLVGRIDQLKASIDTLLNDPTFLPEGGFLGFGLSHTYPFQTPPEDTLARLVSTSTFAGLLKGTDAEVKRVCEALGLDVSLKALYSEQRETARHPCCLTDWFLWLNFDDGVEIEGDGNFLRLLEDEKGATVVYPYDFDSFDGWEWMEKAGKPIVWIKPFEQGYTFKEPYIAWGNDAHMAHTYGNVCLVAVVGKVSERIA